MPERRVLLAGIRPRTMSMADHIHNVNTGQVIQFDQTYLMEPGKTYAPVMVDGAHIEMWEINRGPNDEVVLVTRCEVVTGGRVQ